MKTTKGKNKLLFLAIMICSIFLSCASTLSNTKYEDRTQLLNEDFDFYPFHNIIRYIHSYEQVYVEDFLEQADEDDATLRIPSESLRTLLYWPESDLLPIDDALKKKMHVDWYEKNETASNEELNTFLNSYTHYTKLNVSVTLTDSDGNESIITKDYRVLITQSMKDGLIDTLQGGEEYVFDFYLNTNIDDSKIINFYLMDVHVLGKDSPLYNYYKGTELVFYFSDPDNAILHLNKAIDTGKNFAEPHYMLGYFYNRLGVRYKENSSLQEAKKMFNKAIDSLKRSYKYDPSNVKALKEIGFAYIELGRYENALHYLEKGLEINDQYILLYHEMLFIYAQMNQPQKTIETYLRQIDAFDNYGNAYIGYNNVHIAKIGLEDYETEKIYIKMDAYFTILEIYVDQRALASAEKMFLLAEEHYNSVFEQFTPNAQAFYQEGLMFFREEIAYYRDGFK